MAIRCSRRASARSFSMCLNSSNVVDPMTRRSPAVRIGLIIVARSIVPPVVAPAPTVEWISSMNRIARGRAASASHDGLEALLEVAAEPRAGKQRARVEREHLGAAAGSRARRPAAAAMASPSAMAVLPTPASPTNTGLFLRRRQRTSIVRCSSVVRPISGSSRPCARAIGQVHAVGRERIARRDEGPSSPLPAGASPSPR